MSGTGRPRDWESAGAGTGDVVVSMLRGLGYLNAFPRPVSSSLCPEPIVATAGTWERESRQDGEERGSLPVDVLVCCDDPSDAEATCRAVERDLRHESWVGVVGGWHLRVAAVDSELPASRGRDRSGRWLWGFPLTLTVVRSL